MSTLTSTRHTADFPAGAGTPGSPTISATTVGFEWAGISGTVYAVILRLTGDHAFDVLDSAGNWSAGGTDGSGQSLISTQTHVLGQVGDTFTLNLPAGVQGAGNYMIRLHHTAEAIDPPSDTFVIATGWHRDLHGRNRPIINTAYDPPVIAPGPFYGADVLSLKDDVQAIPRKGGEPMRYRNTNTGEVADVQIEEVS